VIVNPPKQETFDETVSRFRDFLQSQGWPSKIAWLQREHLLVAKIWRFWVREPGPHAELGAKATYELGLKQGYGIRLDGICADENTTFATVFVPRDHVESEQAMMLGGVKLSIPTKRPYGLLVRNRAQWFVLKKWSSFRNRKRARTLEGFFDSTFGLTPGDSRSDS
jgi:hypothetical protein